ncbi:MAG: TonB-dependent receptor [Bryobacterales bacterium]|nr:TonB-dependent receptor [Bryobacterales bacterium]
MALFTGLAVAQIGTSTITGRVTDPTGAVIPGVEVTVVNVETNFQFTGKTNDEGLYRVPSLQPGPYRLVFQVGGFKRLVREDIRLRTGDVLAVNVGLEVGNVAESVEITGAAPLLETETSSVGSVLQGQTLYTLPMYQRFVMGAVLFIPGVSAGTSYGSSLSGFSVAGQRSSAIGAVEDGTSVNDPGEGSAGIKTVQNSVAEVKVLTTVLPAEYGHSGGGMITIVKKTGTNEWHGMASIYGRSRSMQHRTYHDRERSSQPTPGNPNGQRNFFLLPDANVGGPILIPKLYDGRNKSFFFFGYQKLIEKKTNQYFIAVPTPEMEKGDFTFGGVGRAIYDPNTTRQLADGSWARDPFSNKLIPLSALDAVARKVLEIHPWKPPNNPATFGADGPASNLSYDERSRTFFEDFNTRLDHQFNPYVKIYASWTSNHANGWGRPSNIRLPDWDTGSTKSPSTNQNSSLGLTWVIGPSLVNDVRLGYYRRWSQKMVPSFMKDYGKILGIPNISPALLPAFGTGGAGSADSIYGLTLSGPNQRVDETITFRDDLTRMWGTHVFKMGYELLRLRMNSTVTNRPSGDFRFDQMTAGLQANGNPVPGTGNTFAGFLLGYVRQAQFDQELASWLPRSGIHGLYFQDDWKVSPRLTLNLGIRYSIESAYNMKWGQMSNFDPTVKDDLTGRLGGVVHPTTPLNKRDRNNFQPRIGVAWHPLQKWAMRGGFAVNTIDVKFPSSRAYFEEYVAQANYQSPPGDPRPIYRISQIPAPVVYTIRPNGTSPYLGTNYSARTQEWWDSNTRNPYILNWNLSVQYQISSTYVLDLMYQGSSGVGLIERWQANTFPIDYAKDDPALRAAVYKAPQNYRPWPQFGDILFRSNYGHSTYHGATVKLERRFGQGLTFQTFFTFSKSINSQDNDNSGSGVAPIQNRSLEKARAGYDRPKRYVNTLTWELPVGKGRHFLNRGGWSDRIIGGWQTAWMVDLEDGPPLTFSFANSPYNYYPTFAGTRRPDLVSAPKIRDGWRDMGDRFNVLNENPIIDINAFAYPAAFTPGNSGRNILGTIPKIAMDASAQKYISLTEKFQFLVRLDIHSVQKMLFNIYNFTAPSTTVDFTNPKAFAKLTAGPTTAPWGGTALMNLQLQLSW